MRYKLPRGKFILLSYHHKKKKKTYVPFIASESLSIYKVQVIKVLAVFLWYVYPSIVQISNPER